MSQTVRTYRSWREYFLNKMIWIVAVAGLIQLILSISPIIESGLFYILIIDAIGIIGLFSVAIFKGLGIVTRALIVSFFAYVIGITLTVNYSSISMGMFYLFTIPVLSALFFGFKPGVYFLLLNAFILLCLRLLGFSPLIFFEEPYITSGMPILVLYFNFLSLNAVITIPVAMLMEKLKKSLVETEKVKDQMEIQNKLLVTTNEELDQFLYRAAHELRSPLSSLLGLINISLTESRNDDSDYNLELMNKTVNQLDQRLKDILVYSKNRKDEVVFEEIELKSFCQDIVDTFKHADLKISYQVSLDEKAIVNSDSARLRIILDNFVSNAVKYADTDKDKPYVKLSMESNSDTHCIMVEDNGEGIEEEEQKKIFQRFYRSSPNAFGAGLGLYLADMASEKLGANIEVTSEPGVGSVFKVFLPKAYKNSNGVPHNDQ